jgi:hypothetical protein
MNIAEKLERALPVIDSIAGHVDEDAALRKAALDQIKARCDAAKESIDAEVQAKIDALSA